MTEGISLAKFSLNNSTNKEKIIHILSQEWPLSTKQIFENLTKDYSAEISYQAVHKALTELESENTVEKEKKGWKLKKEWLQKGQQFFNKSLEKYSGTINRYDIPINFEGTLVFEFDNFTDYCVKTAELLASKRLAKNDDGYFICVLEYAYWTFKFKFEHLELLLHVMKNCPKSKNIIRKDNPFGRWIREQYIRINAVSAPIGTKIDVNEDIFVQGDYIIQSTIDPEGKKIIEKYWNKWKNLNDNFKDFGIQQEPKIHITAKLTKNPKLANFLMKQIETYFEVKK